MLEAISRHTVSFYHSCTSRYQNYIREIPGLCHKVKEITRTQSDQLILTIKELAISFLINAVPALGCIFFFPGPFFFSTAVGFVCYKQMHVIVSDVSRIFEPINKDNKKHFFAKLITKITYVVLGGIFCILGIPYTQIIFSMFCGGRLGAMINPNYWQIGKSTQQNSSSPQVLHHNPLSTI